MRHALAVAALVLTASTLACGSGGNGILGAGRSSTTQPSAGEPASEPGGKKAAPGAGASDLDPCKLLTKEDARAALLRDVGEGKSVDAGGPLGQKRCFYGVADGVSIQLSLITTSGLSSELRRSNNWTAKEQFKAEKGLGPSTAITGLGEDAFLRGYTIFVLRGDTDLSLQIVGLGSGAQEQQKALQAAAANVLSRLP